jgi:Ssp1 endopeptidase immunity protein Rap1a
MPEAGRDLREAFVRLTLIITFVFLVAAPAHAQDKVPKDGNDMLEFCSHVVDALDNPASQVGASVEYARNTFKQGWCAGHLQTIREMIVFWQVQVAKTVAILGGDQNPPVDALTQTIEATPSMTCIPNEVSMAQMARILVKWLHDHPERLHERTSILTLDAFHDAFACHAESKKSTK